MDSGHGAGAPRRGGDDLQARRAFLLEEFKKAYKRRSGLDYRETRWDAKAAGDAVWGKTLDGLVLSDYFGRALVFLEKNGLRMSLSTAINCVNSVERAKAEDQSVREDNAAVRILREYADIAPDNEEVDRGLRRLENE